MVVVRLFAVVIGLIGALIVVPIVDVVRSLVRAITRR